MKQRLYIDANAALGRTNYREVGIPYKTESLLEQMKYHRVHASLVNSSVSRDYAFTKGNSELINEIKKSERLMGLAVVVPHVEYELENGYGYLDQLLEAGIKGFKVYPKASNHIFDPFTIEKLAGYMIEKNIPLFVNAWHTSWQEMRENLAAFPELNMVLCNTSWTSNRNLFPLLEKFDNLYFDISANQANDILQTCKKHFGIDRVLYGTDYPNKVMGALKASVEYSELSEGDKDKIAHLNVAKLLNVDINEVQPYKDEECMLDEIALKADSGQPLDDILVIDSHTHMVDEEHKTVSLYPMLNGDPKGLIRKMDLMGIDQIITSPWEGIMTNGIDSNETTLKANKDTNNRILAYATCNPNYEEDIDAVINIYHEKHRFIGIKPYYPMHRRDLLDPVYDRWFEYGNKHKLIMLVHSGPEEIAKKVEILSDKYKDMTFILAHSGINYATAKYNVVCAKKRDNVYLEITYTALTNGVIEYMVDEVGADRVLFGTDMPMRDPAPQFAWVCYANISVEDKKKILGGNIKKLIDRCYK